MNWELREHHQRNLLSSEPPLDTDGHSARGPVPDPLTVSVPHHLAAPDEAAAVTAGGPSDEPVPVSELRDTLPPLRTGALPHHDLLRARIMHSFESQLGGLAEYSMTALLDYLQEGHIRVNIDQLWDGSLTSPTLYDKDGHIIGHLRLTASLSGGDRGTGPSTTDPSIEALTTATRYVQGSTSVLNALGIRGLLSARFSAPSRPVAG
ncbi:MAG: hypothetical protein JF597_09150 [Streptomyces sp.]|uniref:hypothetical protein n=1 Tax=Streptomyces sp. TaxID=1931 RepID=UPI0025E84AE6|nr:hypothetical protein [Streptomyces sp.]MBW8793740.1 hypothetical protein [Streptomyces sp.]